MTHLQSVLHLARKNQPIDNMCGILHNHIQMKKLRVLKTTEFEKWFSKLQPKLKAIVTARLDLISVGHFGDHKRFDGLIELRWKNGTRVYTFMWGEAIVVALNGGNKNAQQKDINKAKKIRNEILEGARTVQK